MTKTVAKDIAPLTASELESLRRLRLDRTWSYKEMAESIGLVETTLHAILERGTTPRATTLYLIRQWLNSGQHARTA